MTALSASTCSPDISNMWLMGMQLYLVPSCLKENSKLALLLCQSNLRSICQYVQLCLSLLVSPQPVTAFQVQRQEESHLVWKYNAASRLSRNIMKYLEFYWFDLCFNLRLDLGFDLIHNDPEHVAVEDMTTGCPCARLGARRVANCLAAPTRDLPRSASICLVPLLHYP